MTGTIKMRALMSVKATVGRKAAKRGETFNARDEQDARDLVQMGQAERVTGAVQDGKAGKA